MGALFIIIKKVQYPIIILCLSLAFGSIGYKIIYPDAPWLKIIFMVAITLATVGYGDILHVEDNPVALIYTMFLIIAGMGVVLYAVSVITAFIIEGHLKNVLIMETLRREIHKIKDHYIICGAGQTGMHVIHEMDTMKQHYVVIDIDETNIHKLEHDYPNALYIIGDATDDEVLSQANISKAKGLVAALASDKDNLFLTVTAKLFNPNLKIVSKLVDVKISHKLKNAGATYVVSPNLIGGLRIASEILRPNVVGFLDRMLRGKDKSMRVEEMTVTSTCKYIGSTFLEADFYKKTGLNILAYSLPGEDFMYNPSNETVIMENLIILVICNVDQRLKLEKFLS